MNNFLLILILRIPVQLSSQIQKESTADSEGSLIIVVAKHFVYIFLIFLISVLIHESIES